MLLAFSCFFFFPLLLGNINRNSSDWMVANHCWLTRGNWSILVSHYPDYGVMACLVVSGWRDPDIPAAQTRSGTVGFNDTASRPAPYGRLTSAGFSDPLGVHPYITASLTLSIVHVETLQKNWSPSPSNFRQAIDFWRWVYWRPRIEEIMAHGCWSCRAIYDLSHVS